MALDNTCVEHDESDSFQMVCHGCSQELLLRGLEPMEEGECPSCGAVFVVPQKFGDYMLQDLIDSDAVISTFAATDLKLQRQVHVKLVDKDFIDINTDFSKGLNLPLNKGIATVYSSEFVEQGMLLVTEFIEGKTLKQHLEDGDHFTEENILEIGSRVAGSLAFASANGVIHGNLTPGAIWVSSKGEVKVGDFFLRTNLCNENSSPDKIGKALDVRYASPSKLKHLSNDEKSDIYSLGIILYQLFTRVLPFPAQYYHEAIQERQTVSIQNPRILNSNIPEDVAEMIVSLLVQDGTYNSFSDVISFFEGRQQERKPAVSKKSAKGGARKPAAKKQPLKPKQGMKAVRQSPVSKPNNRQIEKLSRSLFFTRLVALVAIIFGAILFMSRYYTSTSAGKASEQFLSGTLDKMFGGTEAKAPADLEEK